MKNFTHNSLQISVKRDDKCGGGGEQQSLTYFLKRYRELYALKNKGETVRHDYF